MNHGSVWFRMGGATGAVAHRRVRQAVTKIATTQKASLSLSLSLSPSPGCTVRLLSSRFHGDVGQSSGGAAADVAAWIWLRRLKAAMSSSRMDRWMDGWMVGWMEPTVKRRRNRVEKEESVVECRSVGFSRAKANKIKNNNQDVPVEEGSDETDGRIISTASLTIKSHVE